MSERFEARFFETLDAEYSEYFILESRNELSGYLEDVEIDGFFNLLKQFGKIEFRYKDILEYYQSNSN
ncbi:hypothetical protein, partial [Paenibacillus campinasensis]